MSARTQSDPRGSSPSLSCEDARLLTAKFVRGGLERKVGALLRRHLAGCEECRTDYREALETAGRLGAHLREARETQGGPEPDAERRKRIVALSAQTSRGSKRSIVTRAVLLTASFVFLFAGLTHFGWHPEPATVTWLGGEVGVANAVLGSAAEAEVWAAADWCWTGDSSHARIEMGRTTLLLEPKTQVLLEDRRSRSLHLRAGALTIYGPCEVLTARGMVEVHEGEAYLSFRSGVLRLESRGGRVGLTSPSLTRVLESGDEPLVVE